ncbi:MAG: clan AA aspartic protease [Armatimonadota bacterium]|nr:clan AA aspartic protease [Armatimonadota bacterium]
MIPGIVTPNLQAIIHLQVRGPQGDEEEIEAFVDTGFDQFLMLPSSVIHRLNLLSIGSIEAMLAHGGMVQSSAFEAVVVWDDQERIVPAVQTEGNALVGMALLHSYDLRIQVIDDGSVTIEALN